MKVRLTALFTVVLTTSALAAPSKSPATPAIQEIVLVYKTHFDIGYTHLASETVHSYRTKMMDGALAVVEQNKNLPADQQFVWTVSGWPMKKILEDWPGQTPERQQQVRDAFKAGRFAVHALPFTMQTDMMEPEALVRGLRFASELARAAGKPLPTAAKMTDVPEHSKILPTLLKHAGVHFLHLGCNPASATPRVPPLFWWEGPDGSRLLTMYSAFYGGDLLPPADWPHKTWLAMNMTGDNQGPPSPDTVQKDIAKIKARYPDVRIRVGSLDDFGDRILKEDLSALPVIRQDMPDTWIHGLMCDPAGVALARSTVPDLFAAETLHSLLDNWRVTTPDSTQTIADSYENSALYYEHTWGGSMSWIIQYLPPKGHLGQCSNWFYDERFQADLKTTRFDRLRASWEEHTDYARNADKLLRPAITREMNALAAAVDRNGPRTVAFNPLPWPRDAVINAKLVKNIPAGGYLTLDGPATPPPSSESATKNTLENDAFLVTVDPALGTITSLVHKPNGRELVDATATHGFGQLLHERFSADEVARFCKAYVRGSANWAMVELGKPNMPPSSQVPYQALTPSGFSVSTSTRGDLSTLEMRAPSRPGGFNYPVTTRVILLAGAPYIDLEMTIEKPADNWPEAGWICLPFKVDTPRFRVGRNGFIMDPAKDIIAGANRYLYAVGTGVAVIDAANHGVGVCGPDTPLVSLGEPGGWKFDHDYVPKKPAVYFNLFNNQWSTNYRLWNEGKWTYRFRIWSFDKYDAASSLVTPALEMRYPVQTAAADGPAGPLPATRSGLTVSRPGTMVTAFCRNPLGAGTLLRIWEQVGAAGGLTVTIPGNFNTATPVGLRGEMKSTAPLRITDGKLTFPLDAYAPASFILE